MRIKHLIFLFALASGGCDRPAVSTPATAPETSPTTEPITPVTLDTSLHVNIDVKAISTVDGLYVVGDNGVWLLKGTQAVRVVEVPAFTHP